MRLECGCPSKYPDWHNQDINLSGQLAHVLPIPNFFHMPLAYTAYLKRQWQEITSLELNEQWPGMIMTQTGFLRGRIINLLETEQTMSRFINPLPSPFNVRCKLHEDGLGSMRKSVMALQAEIFDEGKMPKELYISHLTCLRCDEARGGEKILLMRRWMDSPKLKARLK